MLDMTRIAQGGSAVRFVIGEYGSGKTFFLTLARNVAAEKKLVVMNADLSPERRLHATGGQAAHALRRADPQHVDAHETGWRRAGERARAVPR